MKSFARSIISGCLLTLHSCVTFTGTLDIPGPDGKAPIGHISGSWTYKGKSESAKSPVLVSP